MPKKNKNKVSLFYSYSHCDEKHCETLKRVLAPARARGILEDWSDRNIRPGQQLMPTINRRLRESDIIVLLLSRGCRQRAAKTRRTFRA